MRQDETVDPAGRHPYYIQLVLDRLEAAPAACRGERGSRRAGIGIAVAASLALAMVGITLFAIGSRSGDSTHPPTTDSRIAPSTREAVSEDSHGEALFPAKKESELRRGGLTGMPVRVSSATRDLSVETSGR